MDKVSTYFKNCLNTSIPSGRLEYLLSYFLLVVTIIALVIIMGQEAAEGLWGTALSILSLPILAAISYKRLLDLKLNILWLLALMIPLGNLVLGLYLTFAPGKK